MKWYEPTLKKDPHKKDKDKHDKIPKNIYETKTLSDQYKKYHTVHYLFKYKYVAPLLIIAKKLLKNVLIKKVKKTSHNTNLYIFDKAFEETIKKWNLYYLRNSGPINKRQTRTQCMIRVKNDPYLRVMKELVNTLVHYDTAYREFFNVLMHEITLGMVKEYSRSNKYHDKMTNHLFFTTDIYEVNYYVLEKVLRYNVDLKAVKAEDLLNYKRGKK